MLNKKGMTILELMISSLILSIGLLGYTSGKMKAIFDSTYSNNFSYITTTSSDFQNILLNELRHEPDSEVRKEILNEYINAPWSTDNYSSDLDDCSSSHDTEDILYCDRDKMIEYNVKTLKETIKKEVLSARFDFISCNSGISSCLIIAWANSSTEINSCKANTTSCHIMEF